MPRRSSEKIDKNLSCSVWSAWTYGLTLQGQYLVLSFAMYVFYLWVGGFGGGVEESICCFRLPVH